MISSDKWYIWYSDYSFPILSCHLQEWLPDHSLGTCLEAFSSDQGLYIYSPPVDLQLGWNRDTHTLHVLSC
ncbi:hypothetical protein CHUAL_000057 [Chamberlinius hualienensis]